MLTTKKASSEKSRDKCAEVWNKRSVDHLSTDLYLSTVDSVENVPKLVHPFCEWLRSFPQTSVNQLNDEVVQRTSLEVHSSVWSRQETWRGSHTCIFGLGQTEKSKMATQLKRVRGETTLKCYIYCNYLATARNMLVASNPKNTVLLWHTVWRWRVE